MVEYDVSDGVCLLRLNSPPVNTITYALLEELQASLRKARADAGVSGIVLAGTPEHFSAGADTSLFRAIADAEDAVHMSRVFQEAFQEVEDSPKPVVAAVAGRMMGGALELAMACHYRICATGSVFGMPEVSLAIVPGAGGTGRLPRLVGMGAALRMLLTGQTLDAEEALRLGLVDEVCDGAALIERARALLQSAPAPRKTRERTDKIGDAATNAAAFQGARKLIDATRPEIISPLKIMEAVRAGLEESFAAGLRREQTGFAECMATPATRNKLYLFFATRDTGKAPHLAGARPIEVAKAAVIGMGTMGTGIAQALLMGGIPVVVYDADSAAVQRGVGRIRSSVEKRVEQGKMPAERAEAMLSLLSAAATWADIAEANLVIEAVFEDVAAKRSVIAAVEDACAADAIIASNTSTLSLDVLAEGMRHPERLIGLHFFNPAHRMPLLEIIARDGTAPGVVATALKFAKTIRKTPLLVRNREGFLVNRIFIPYFKEAFWLLEDGANAQVVDAAMAEFGFPMGPLALIDMAGLDILLHTDRVLSGAFPRHGPLPPIVARLVEGGHLGQKTHSGVYRYEPGDYTPHPNEALGRLLAKARQEAGHSPRQVGKDEITQRLVLRMVSEAFWVLEEGIAQRESDIDAAMVLGTGFPDFRGGVLRYARDLGLGRVLAELEALAGRFGERFAPPRLLRDMKGTT